MLKIIYKEGERAYSDFELMEKAHKIIGLYKDNVIDEFSVSSSNIILALRVLVCRGELSHSEIIFQYENELITIDEYSVLSSHPKGFCDYDVNFLKELVKSKLKK
jgi:hypothetical protein